MKCSICVSSFNFIFLRKHICKFCYKPVCLNCSNQKMRLGDTCASERICDVCFSTSIKQRVSATFSGDKQTLKNEISNIQSRYSQEKLYCEREGKYLVEIEREIEEIKHKEQVKELDLNNEHQMLIVEIEQIEKDYQELSSRLEVVTVNNWEADIKINILSEENQEIADKDFDISERIKGLGEDVERLEADEDRVESKDQGLDEDLKVYKMKAKLEEMNIEKREYLMKIKKLREGEKVKNMNLEMLISKLAASCDVRDEEAIDIKKLNEQFSLINELERQLSKFRRKQEIDGKVCKCCVI